MFCVRMIEIPPCKVVASVVGFFGEPEFDKFDVWMTETSANLPQVEVYPRDYLTGVDGKFQWLYLYQDGMKTDGFEVLDFPGGLYAVVTGIDGADNAEEMAAVNTYAAEHHMEIDPTRRQLGNMLTVSEEAKAAMGYEQMDYYVPLRVKKD